MASSNYILVALFGLLGFLSTNAPAQDFRVDTELFQDQDKKPSLEMLTVFSEGKVYDFRLTDPRETTVFDPVRGQFTLLDEARQVKAGVTTQELLDFSLDLNAIAAQQKDRLFAFCAVPNFETTEAAIEENGQPLTELRLTGKPLTYVARGQKVERQEAVKAYRQFADWCARLNASRLGNLPAGARLALNQALAERELLPLEITRVTYSGPGPLGRKLELKSQHRVNWTLSGEDQKKIERAADMMAMYKVVSYTEYCDPNGKQPKQAKAEQVRR